MKKLYINIDDLQGTNWALGKTDTIQGWREIAQFWADSDGNEDVVEALAEMPEEDVIDYVSEIWDINIVPYDKDNEEHNKLRERYDTL